MSFIQVVEKKKEKRTGHKEIKPHVFILLRGVLLLFQSFGVE